MRRIYPIILMLAVALHVSAQKDTTQLPVQSAYGTTIGQEDMNNRDQSSNAIDAIRGRVAGMTVDKSGENAMNAVRLRGTVSLSGSNDPLIIVDGVLGDMSLLSTINPTDIESFRMVRWRLLAGSAQPRLDNRRPLDSRHVGLLVQGRDAMQQRHRTYRSVRQSGQG